MSNSANTIRNSLIEHANASCNVKKFLTEYFPIFHIYMKDRKIFVHA